jgi:thiol-disulfide isomerase/thioredoxin
MITFKFYILLAICGITFNYRVKNSSDLLSLKRNVAYAKFPFAEKDSEVHLFDFTRANLNDSKKYPWFKHAYDDYQPKTMILDSLKTIKEQIHVIVFGGSWCSDTKELLPEFYKTIELAGIPANKITLVGVDRDKSSHDRRSKRYNISRVPTFILFYKGKEIGRIVESVNQSIEGDMLKVYKDYCFK